ncbi:MAG TPA: Uma2 family endonuclease [Bacteroidetes bacterium]|nr:Uma2 family endonuclease [Bacteroidota bacterium]
MVQDTNILTPILETPRMPELINELQVHWEDEQRLREEYYEKIQPGDKWEFINGKIIMHSPAKDKHTEARKNLSYILQTQVAISGEGTIKDETALVTFARNDYLPDIVFFSKEKAALFTPDTWKYPAPDFVVEILSKSTEATDKGIKKEDYAANGTKEYWLVDPDAQSVEQYILDNKKQVFKLFSKKTFNDNIDCQVLNGLSFPVAAIFDEKKKLEVVRGLLK